MKKSNLLVVCLILLVVVGFGLFFVNQSRLKEKDAILDEKMAEFAQQQEVLSQAQLDMQKSIEEKEQLARQADEAKKMAEAQAEKERLERERLVAELNARLAREAEERRLAEERHLELAEKMKGLVAAQQEAQAALAALEAAKGTEASQTEAAALQQKMEQQNQAMVALVEENRALKERHEALKEQQRVTEEAILKMGGVVQKHTFTEVVIQSFEDMYKGVVNLLGPKD